MAKILTDIVDAAGKVNRLVSEVSAASEELAQGIDQVNTAVAQMDRVTQGNAASAEESSSASEELNAQARELMEMVNTLVGIVGASDRQGSAPSAPGLPAMPSCLPVRQKLPTSPPRYAVSSPPDITGRPTATAATA